jgi:hypothetical protein
VAPVDDEPPAFEGGDADAGPAAAPQCRRQLPRVRGDVAGPGHGHERRQRKLRAAAEADVPVEPISDTHAGARDVEEFDDVFEVGYDGLVVAVDRRGGRSGDGHRGGRQREADAAVEAIRGEREVLEPEVEPGPRRDRDHAGNCWRPDFNLWLPGNPGPVEPARVGESEVP